MLKDKFPKGIEVVGSAVIENFKGQILLTKSPRWKNKWVMPGGHIEVGESIEEGILREAKEETGLELEPIKVIHSGELIESGDFFRPAHFIFFDLLCRAESEDVKLDAKELSEYIWVSPEEALEMDIAESYAKVVEKYIEFKRS